MKKLVKIHFSSIFHFNKKSLLNQSNLFKFSFFSFSNNSESEKDNSIIVSEEIKFPFYDKYSSSSINLNPLILKIIKYLERTKQIYERMSEESISLNEELYEFPNKEYLKNELIRINKQIASYSRELYYYDKIFKLLEELHNNNELLIEAKSIVDNEIIKFASSELEKLSKIIKEMEKDVVESLLPEDQVKFIFIKDDNKNVTMEVNSASGGIESTLFAEDLVKMYQLYCSNMGWDWKEIEYIKDFSLKRGCKSGIN